MPDKLFVGQKAKEVDRSPALGGVTGIRMLASDNVEITSGDTTSNNAVVWEIDSPWATQTQADWLLSQMAGYDYQPYTADTVQLDPAAELGDYLTVGPVYSGLFSERNTYGTNFTADVAAPNQQDIDHEYPFQTDSERKFNRLSKQMAAEFRVQADEIAAKVSEVGGDNRSFGWSMKVEGMHWYANGSEVMKCTQAGLEVIGKIKGGTISIGSGFSVDANGNMSCKNANLSGNLKIGGTDIQDWVLRSGANSGYEWANRPYGGSTPWQYSLTGGTYGYNYNAASQQYTTSYPSYFRCGMLQLSDNVIVSGTVSVTINGTPYRLVGFVNT